MTCTSPSSPGQRLVAALAIAVSLTLLGFAPFPSDAQALSSVSGKVPKGNRGIVVKPEPLEKRGPVCHCAVGPNRPR